MAFCHACGKKGASGLCEDCKDKRTEEFCEFNKIALDVCIECERGLVRGRWAAYGDLKRTIISAVTKNMKILIHGVKVKIMPDISGVIVVTRVKQEILVTVKSELKDKKKNYIIPIILKFRKCERCQRANSEYFEGILQLRNIPEDRDEIFEFIHEELRLANPKGISVNKEGPVKGGYDIYLTSGKYIKNLANKIYKRFGGEMKITAKLQSYDNQTSKDLFRVSAVIKFPNMSSGDIVLFKKNLFRVTSFSCRKAICERLDGNGRSNLDLVNDDFEVIAKKSDFMKTKVSKVHPQIEVIDPKTFQSIPVHAQDLWKGLRIDQNVTVIYHNGIWIVRG